MKFNIGKLTPFIFLAIFPCMAIAQGNSNSGSNGQPFQDLQAQIDELQQQVLSLQLGEFPTISVDVDCGDEETVSDALALYADVPNPLIINIFGICAESALINRDGVTLRGRVGEGDGITSGTWVAAWVTEGASQVRIENLSLRGGFAGMACLNGASALGTGLDIVGFADSTTKYGSGVLAFHGGNCEVIGSTIENHSNGVTVGTNSDVVFRGVTITDSLWGANVYSNGSLSLDRLDFGSISASSIVSNNITGINVRGNGSVRLVQVDVEDNLDEGIHVHSGGSLESTGLGAVNVSGNSSHGVTIDKLSNAFFGGNVYINDNGGSGVQCWGTVSIFDFDIVEFSNNGLIPDPIEYPNPSNGYSPGCDEYPPAP